METKYVKLFLRGSLAAGFLSAVADRFGFWPSEISAWGSWDSFVAYTGDLNPWAGSDLVQMIAIVATLLEVVLALCLLVGFRIHWTARFSGFLLLAFALAMTFTGGLKASLDYSVFSAAAAAFGLGLIKEPYLEIDRFLQDRID